MSFQPSSPSIHNSLAPQQTPSPTCIRLFPAEYPNSTSKDNNMSSKNKNDDDDHDNDNDGICGQTSNNVDPSDAKSALSKTTTTIPTTTPTDIKNNDGDDKGQERRPLRVRTCRDLILGLSVPLASLCQGLIPEAQPSSDLAATLKEPMAQLFWGLLQLAHACGFDLAQAIHHKMLLNKQKYPVELCKGKAGKYTEYSASTGITLVAGQSLLATFELHADGDGTTTSSSSVASKVSDWWYEAMDLVVEFREERNWSQYHTPRNIVLALLGEVGELAEVLQFEGDGDDDDNDSTKLVKLEQLDNLRKEMADVAIYALSLASLLSLSSSSSSSGAGAHSSRQTNVAVDQAPSSSRSSLRNDLSSTSFATQVAARIEELWNASSSPTTA